MREKWMENNYQNIYKVQAQERRYTNQGEYYSNNLISIQNPIGLLKGIEVLKITLI